MEVDDVRQEMELVLYKCLMGYDPKRSNKFHTYLHTAMENRLRKLWGPFVKKETGARSVHPAQLLYLGAINDLDGTSMGRSRTDRLLVENLTNDLDPSLEFHMEDLGFKGHEQTWLGGRCLGLSIREIAAMQGLPEAVVREGYESTQKKIRRMKRRGREDDNK